MNERQRAEAEHARAVADHYDEQPTSAARMIDLLGKTSIRLEARTNALMKSVEHCLEFQKAVDKTLDSLNDRCNSLAAELYDRRQAEIKFTARIQDLESGATSLNNRVTAIVNGIYDDRQMAKTVFERTNERLNALEATPNDAAQASPDDELQQATTYDLDNLIARVAALEDLINTLRTKYGHFIKI